jgi:hypothetical protein
VRCEQDQANGYGQPSQHVSCCASAASGRAAAASAPTAAAAKRPNELIKKSRTVFMIERPDPFEDPYIFVRSDGLLIWVNRQGRRPCRCLKWVIFGLQRAQLRGPFYVDDRTSRV